MKQSIVMLACSLLFCSGELKSGSIDQSGVVKNPSSVAQTGGCASTFSTVPLIYLNVPVGYAANKQIEPSIAVSSLNPLKEVAVWIDYNDGYSHVATGHSTDGGATWVDGGTAPFINVGSFQYSGDPAIVADVTNENIFYMSFVAFTIDPQTASITSGIYVARSTDAGQTWLHIDRMDTNSPDFNDKPWIAIDQSNTNTRGNLYVVWGFV
jgi:hypothetical protein